MIFPSGKIPTLNFRLPFSKFSLIFSHPLNPPSSLLFLPIAHFRLASIGFISSLSSCPYKHNPASSLSVSRAPNPIGFTLLSINFFYISSAWVFKTDISNPSSPVYPDRVT